MYDAFYAITFNRQKHILMTEKITGKLNADENIQLQH